ncbi:MAG TPA: gamma-glutamyltransferase [Haliangium sp.]|nr:gamma-glutamyltransferase [Haliangium sp.]
MKQRRRAAIAAGSEHTRAAGERLLELGGNVVDIAVGAALTAMVSEILMCSHGGSALVMLRVGRVTELIEGCDAMPGQRPPRPSWAPDREQDREMAGPRWHELDVPGDHGQRVRVRAGHAAVAVPGALAALETAWRRHGRLPWRELMAPGRELARDGIPTTPETARWLAAAPELFAADELGRRSFFPDGSAPASAGALLRIPHLADALDYISREGARAFYRGDIAALFARDMETHGGLVTREDLAAYQVAVRRPLALASRHFEVALPPPPSAAGAMAGLLIGLLELDWDQHPGDARRALHHASVQARVHAQGLADEIQRVAAELDIERARALLAPAALLGQDEARGKTSSPSTTHVAVVGEDGSAVSITATMGRGAGVSIAGTGIPCNGSAGETAIDGDGRYVTRPGARLISNLCPIVAFSERQGDVLALGAIGGARAPTALAQVWLAHAREGLPVEAAVVAPRLHVERSAEGRAGELVVHCEPGIPTRQLAQSFAVHAFEAPDRFFGRVTLASRDDRGHLHTATDTR